MMPAVGDSPTFISALADVVLTLHEINIQIAIPMPAVKNGRIVVTAFGGPEVLKYIEEDLPEPGPAEVRVKVLAAGVAYADVLMRRGFYPGTPPPPFTPGYDLVGEIDALGKDVTQFAVGQRVGALTVRGAYSQFANRARRTSRSCPGFPRSGGSGLPDFELRDRLSDAASHRECLQRAAHLDTRRGGRSRNGVAAAWRTARAHDVRHRVEIQTGCDRRGGRHSHRLPRLRIFQSACASFRRAAWMPCLTPWAERTGGAPTAWFGAAALLSATACRPSWLRTVKSRAPAVFFSWEF